MKYNLLTAILIISVLLLAGCTEKECKTRNDCTPKGACYISNCIKNECVNTLKRGCTCGDGKCRETDGESECTCPDDCGDCAGKVGDFMEKKCVDDKCVTQIMGQKQSSVEDLIKYVDSRQTKAQLSLKATFDTPFNVKQSLMNINIKIDNIAQDVSDLKITKIKIIEHTGTKDRRGNWINDQPLTLAEETYSKVLFDETSEFDKDFPIYIKEFDSEKKTVNIDVSYELKLPDRYGNLALKQGTFEKELMITMISPDAPVECPTDCNDNNPCTRDYCSESTNFFCEHDITSTGVCCGDDVCSSGEDKCRCPGDCGKCTGNIGDHMVMGCSNLNMCTFQIRNTNVVQPTSKLTDVDLNGASMSLSIDYFIPFDKSSSSFSFTFEPKVFSGIRNLIINKVSLLDKSGTVLGSNMLNKPISEGLPATVSTELSYKSLKAEEKKTVSARFDYSFEEEDRYGEWSASAGTLTYSIGELTILNPS